MITGSRSIASGVCSRFVLCLCVFNLWFRPRYKKKLRVFDQKRQKRTKKRVEVRTKLKKLQFSAHSYVFCFFMFLLIFPVTACVFSHVWTTVCELNHMSLFRCDFHTFAKKSWFCGKNTWFYGIAGFSKSIKNYVFDNVQLLTWIYKKNTQYFSTIWKICNGIYPHSWNIYMFVYFLLH